MTGVIVVSFPSAEGSGLGPASFSYARFAL
jgi:hypothetical protein